MKNPTTDRRTFLRGTAVCGLCMCTGLGVFAGEGAGSGEKIDPKKREYCGYICPEECKFHQATLADDVELKREAFEAWEIEERFGLEFDPAIAFCHRCKAPGKPDGVVVSHCDVRTCVREKKLECCIECDELPACDRDLWRRFPMFKEQVVELQKKYLAQV
jgi:hypothetical protein